MNYQSPIVAEVGQEFDRKLVKKVALRKPVNLCERPGGVSSVRGYGWFVTNSYAAANFYATVNVLAWSNAAVATLTVAASAFVALAGAFWFPSKMKKSLVSV